ncbi:hypothetical protein BCV69DRAFT_145479 [Microstroma glucosiphilum]|uniref:RING-type domain-containing protein n=1 Tax=Pseudomicrostroma glucosiphilum TaxID=1684307 RepID=A0A316UB96_9BASI|nr:hypothetical protein BCV69DRAFT_145479 [Pseudomicrostroma glucosiphilum]PWN22496.1 hypothetical protein BCV69DRAFT_145479 [Pseudomicrostroma glucosiphilum]
MSLRMLHLDALRDNGSRNRQTDVEMQAPTQRYPSSPLGGPSSGAGAHDGALFRTGNASAVGPAPPLDVPATDAAAPAPTAGGETATPTANARRGRFTRGAIQSRISAMRERGTTRDREREDNFTRAFNRLQLAQHMQDLGLTSPAAPPTPITPLRGGGATSTSALIAGRKDARAKKEREEASTLVGPSLSNYFGSGSSSSGTVGGSSSAPNGASNSTAAPANGEASSAAGPPETPGFGSRGMARLGSRGRARGASLSGLSALGQYGEASDSQASFGDLQQGPLSTHLEAPPTQLDAMTEAVAMAEGIDIEVLKQWIEKSLDNLGAVQIDGTGEEAVEKALSTPSHCTTLQSYVNLKRNTIRLMTSSSEPSGVASTAVGYGTSMSVAVESSSGGLVSHPLEQAGKDGDEAFSSARSMPIIQESGLRPARSLSNMPDYDSSALGSSSMLGPATHQLHFEYDCSAPAASIQIFLRASRKHGSWQAWSQKQAEAGYDKGTNYEDPASMSLYQQRGPAPHVLGWPVHSSMVKSGFAQPVKASLSLKLSLYAPPSAATGEGNNNGVAAPAVAASSSAAKGEPAPSSSAPPAQAQSLDTATAVPEEETKEQKIAREKAERETLKLSIVIEGLNESGRPYAQPNLQTTYMRLISLPLRSSAPGSEGATQQEVKRTWTAQVEGQEAEIGPHRFQLQELYGLSSRPPPVIPVQTAEGADGDPAVAGDGGAADLPAATGGDETFALDMDALADGSTGSECLICLSAPTNTLLLPCTHGLCLDCSVQLKDSVKAQRDAERKRGKVPKKKYNCPMCRRGFTSMLHLRVAGDEEEEEGEGEKKTVESLEEMS